jgi:hypothetical protein
VVTGIMGESGNDSGRIGARKPVSQKKRTREGPLNVVTTDAVSLPSTQVHFASEEALSE